MSTQATEITRTNLTRAFLASHYSVRVMAISGSGSIVKNRSPAELHGFAFGGYALGASKDSAGNADRLLIDGGQMCR